MYESKKNIVLNDEKMLAENFPNKEFLGEEFISVHPSGQVNVAIYDPSDDILTQENDVDGKKKEKNYTIHD